MRLRSFLVAAVFSLAVCGCAHRTGQLTPAVAPTMAGDLAHPAQTSGWVDTQLYFGLGPADHQEQGLSEAQWRGFLDKEVTPRFPSGLSVADVYGQWQGTKDPAPMRLRSKLLIIDYPDTLENRGKVEAIRAAWKQQTGQLSVLRVTQAADVSF